MRVQVGKFASGRDRTESDTENDTEREIKQRERERVADSLAYIQKGGHTERGREGGGDGKYGIESDIEDEKDEKEVGKRKFEEETEKGNNKNGSVWG